MTSWFYLRRVDKRRESFGMYTLMFLGNHKGALVNSCDLDIGCTIQSQSSLIMFNCV
jgi:hypothetical protein